MMALDQARISPAQLYFMMLGFIIGSTALLMSGRAAGHDQWIASLLSVTEGLPVALLFTTLAIRLGGRTIIEAAPDVLGRWPGTIAAALFIGYIAHLGSLVLTNYTNFIAATILPMTPEAVVGFALIAVCALAVRGGLEVIARCGMILAPIFLAIVAVDNVLMLNTMKFSRVLPILESPVKALLSSAHAMASFPLNETVAFATLIPFVAGKPRAKYTAVAAAIVSGAVLISLALIRIYSVLGVTARTASYPLFSAVRMIDIGHILTRLEVVVFINVLTMGFVKIAILLYGASTGIAQLLKLRDYRSLVFPLATLMFIISLINFPSAPANAAFAEQIYPLYAPLLQVGFPLLMLLLSWIRGAPRPGPGGQPSKKA